MDGSTAERVRAAAHCAVRVRRRSHIAGPDGKLPEQGFPVVHCLKTACLTHQQTPPARIVGQEAVTLRTPQHAAVHVPAIPTAAGKLGAGQDAQQPVGRIRDEGFAGNPVPHGAWMDMQHFPGSLGREAQVSQHDFEACAQYQTGLACCHSHEILVTGDHVNQGLTEKGQLCGW
jgi:hypothetical protein